MTYETEEDVKERRMALQIIQEEVEANTRRIRLAEPMTIEERLFTSLKPPTDGE